MARGFRTLARLVPLATLSTRFTSTSARRLPPMVPPNLDEPQQQLFDDIVSTRIDVVGKAALFDEDGALRGPWNAEVCGPALGKHLERLATAVRTENSLEARLYEIAILAVGVHWSSQFEWYVHAKIAHKAGVSEEALALIKTAAPSDELTAYLKPDELAVYTLCRELLRWCPRVAVERELIAWTPRSHQATSIELMYP